MGDPMIGAVMIIAAIGGLGCVLVNRASRRPTVMVSALVLALAMVDGALDPRELVPPLLWAALLIVLAPLSLVVSSRGDRPTSMAIHRSLLSLLVADLLVAGSGPGPGSPESAMRMGHGGATFGVLEVLAVLGVMGCVAYCAHHWISLWTHPVGVQPARGIRSIQTAEVSLMTICIVAMAAMAG